MSILFYNCNSLESIDLSNFDTSEVIDMSWMFYGCISLKSIDLSNFDTFNVIYMKTMFYNCSSLESIEISSFDTSNVFDMSWMFYGCNSLKSIDLSNFDTFNVVYMNMMFYNCSSLESIEISSFDTSNVFDMSRMFFGCSSLKSIELSNFDTSKVSKMVSMFYNCSSLKSIDLSNFNTSSVIDMGSMFYGCISLISIDLSNFNMSICYSYNNFFSNISSIKFINLYNFTNDRIISNIFNDEDNHLYVCQKEKIINNPNVYNCCNSNFKAYKCNPQILPSTAPSDNNNQDSNNYDSSDSNNPDSNNNDSSDSNNPDTKNIDSTNINPKPINIDSPTDNIQIVIPRSSSSKISAGAIIGIIGGGVVFIIATILIIVYFVWKRCTYSPSPPPVQMDSATNVTFSGTNEVNSLTLYEYEPENDKMNPIIIIFENGRLGNTKILIDSDKTIDELIRFYFKVIKKPDLYGGKNINFIINGECINPPYPQNSVENLKNKIVNWETIKILVNEIEDD